MTTKDKRRWVTSLASEIPPGPDGQPSHAVGSEVVVVHPVDLPELGQVSMSVPRPSLLLLSTALSHGKRATRLRPQLAKQVKTAQWSQPGLETYFSNEHLVLDFFEEAMASVILGYAALDSYANECIPEAFTTTDKAGSTVDRHQIEGHWGLAKRLSLVLPTIFNRPSLEHAEPDTWMSLQELKVLRDDAGHTHLELVYAADGTDPKLTLFSRLLATDLDKLLRSAQHAMAYYSD